MIYPPAPACQGPSGWEGSRFKSEVNVIISFIDIIFQESFQHSIHSLMLYFKNSSNIPSAIAI